MPNRKIKIGKYQLPLWVAVVLMLPLPFAGFFVGGIFTAFFMDEPDGQFLVGPISVGNERTTRINWPQGNFTGGQLSIVLDIGVSSRIAPEVRVIVDLVDPDGSGASYNLGQFEKFDIKRSDGLMYSSKAINLVPVLSTPRGTVRQFETKQVPLRVKVERKAGSGGGFVWVTSAKVVGKVRELE